MCLMLPLRQLMTAQKKHTNKKRERENLFQEVAQVTRQARIVQIAQWLNPTEAALTAASIAAFEAAHAD